MAAVPATSVPRVDLEYVIETPENVVLTYQVAGPAARLMAFLLDSVVMSTIWFFGVCIISGILAALSLPGMGVAAALILTFLSTWFYFAFQEWYFRGKTLGKHLLGLRVIMDGGYPLTFLAAVLRNFARVADCMPPFYLDAASMAGMPMYGLGFLSMLLTPDFRRIGDILARTIVITEGRREEMAVPRSAGGLDDDVIIVTRSGVPLPQEPIILDKITPLNRSEIGGFVPAPRTLALIEQFLGRRYALTYKRGHDMAGRLARALARRLNYQGDRLALEKYPMAFLASVYATFHRTLDDEEDIALSPREAARKPGGPRRAPLRPQART